MIAATAVSRRRDAMRVVMVAPPWYDVPPLGYGGIEAMLAELVSGLSRRGHDVTLIGAGRAGTGARFLPTYDPAPSERIGEPMPEVLHAAKAYALALDIDADIVHDHSLAGQRAGEELAEHRQQDLVAVEGRRVGAPHERAPDRGDGAGDLPGEEVGEGAGEREVLDAPAPLGDDQATQPLGDLVRHVGADEPLHRAPVGGEVVDAGDQLRRDQRGGPHHLGARAQ
ncbi:glycosyltransferase, partial [Streptosporangium algeriense]